MKKIQRNRIFEKLGELSPYYPLNMNQLITVFTSNFSIGESLLTLDEKCSPEGSDSLLDIAQELGLKQIVVVDHSMIGFKKAHTAFSKLGIQLIFGVKFSAANNRFDESCLRETSHHRVIIFAKNDAGCKELVKLYSEAHTKSDGFLDYSLLKERWSDNLDLVFPFYNSFIHKNNFYGKQCLPEYSFTRPTFFVGDHGLPYDSILRRKTLDYATNHNLNVQDAHFIYYKNRKDIDAFVTYSILTNRKAGKPQTLDRPELEGMGSSDFSVEAFLKKCL